MVVEGRWVRILLNRCIHVLFILVVSISSWANDATITDAEFRKAKEALAESIAFDEEDPVAMASGTQVFPRVSGTEPENTEPYTLSSPYGTIQIQYEAYTIPDWFDIYVGATHVYGSGSTNGDGFFPPIQINGQGTSLTVVVNEGSGNPGTKWWYQVTFTPAPNKAPSVSLQAPYNNSTYNLGSYVTLRANASDLDGSIQVINFYVDGNYVGGDFTPPYTYSWFANRVGPHTVYANAFDNDSADALSEIRNFNVKSPNKQPNVSWVQPANGETVDIEEEIALEVAASDSDGSVSRVDFYIDGSKRATSTSEPHTATWTPFSGGSHTLKAIAYDNKSASRNASITVNVENGADVDVRNVQFSPNPIGRGASPQSAQLTLLNNGPLAITAMNAPLAVKFILSQDAELGGTDDVEIGSMNKTFDLEAGEQVDWVLSSAELSDIEIPPTARGDYTLFITCAIDGTGILNDPQLFNNTVSLPLHVGQLVDLEVYNVEFFPLTNNPGDSPSALSFNILNHGVAGLADFDTQIDIRLVLSRNQQYGDLDDISILVPGYWRQDVILEDGEDLPRSIGAAARQEVVIPSNIAGDYYVFVDVQHGPDSSHVDPEVSNNSTYAPHLITVTGGAEADLSAANLIWTQVFASPGDKPDSVEFDIINNGSYDLVDALLVVSFFLSGEEEYDPDYAVSIGQCEVHGQSAMVGESIPFELDDADLDKLQIPSDAEGQLYLYMMVQHAAASYYTDSSMGNNVCRMETPITIVGGQVVDLEVSNLVFLPRELDPGQLPKKIEFRLKNNGPSDIDYPDNPIRVEVAFFRNRERSSPDFLLGAVTSPVPLNIDHELPLPIPPASMGEFQIPADAGGEYWVGVQVYFSGTADQYDNMVSNNLVFDTSPVVVHGGSEADVYLNDLELFPTTLATGEAPRQVTVTIGNEGVANLYASEDPLLLSLHLSEDAVLDPDDHLLLESSVGFGIKAGKTLRPSISSNNLATIRIPDVPLGLYHVFASIEHHSSSSITSDPDPDNNTVALDQPVWIHRAAVTKPVLSESLVEPGPEQLVQIEWEGFPGTQVRVEIRENGVTRYYPYPRYVDLEGGSGMTWWRVGGDVESPDYVDSGEYTVHVFSRLPIFEDPVHAMLPHSIIVDRPPELSWLPPTVISTNGVTPAHGFRNKPFVFQVEYRDEEGHPPASGYPLLHVYDNDGDEVEYSPFSMVRADNNPFESGTVYSNAVYLPKGLYKHRFEALDEPGLEAVGEAVEVLWGPQVEGLSRGLFVGSTDISKSIFRSDFRGGRSAEDVREAFDGLDGFFASSVDRDLMRYDYHGSDDADAEILTRLDEFRNQMQPGDTFVLYYAGHGDHYSYEDGDEPMTQDELANQMETYDEVLTITESQTGSGWLKDDDLAIALTSWNPDVNMLAIIDACHSGGFWRDSPNASDRDLAGLPSAALFAACAEGSETGYYMDGRGYFTSYILRALDKTVWGHCRADDNRDGMLSFHELKMFVDNESRKVEQDGVVGYIMSTNGWDTMVQFDPVSMRPVAFKNPGFDDDALGGAVFEEAYRPTPPTSLVLDNVAPLDDEAVSCTADGASSIDGSTVSYRYQWQELEVGATEWTRAECIGEVLPASVSVAGNTYRCRVWAVDGNSVSSSNAISQEIIVQASSETPVIVPVPNRVLDAGAIYAEALTCSSTLTNNWYLLKGAGGMVLNRQTGELVWSNAVPGTYAMKARVENSVGSDEVEWTLTVGSGQGPWKLGVSIDPPGAGWVYGVGNPVADGDLRTLVAVPTPGFNFDHWSGALSGSSPSGTVTVVSDATANAHFGQDYDSWVDRNFSPEDRTNAVISGWMADPDGDGVPNGSDYAFVSEPVELTGLQGIMGTNATVTLTFARRTVPHGLGYSMEASTNLVDWVETAFSVTGQMDADSSTGVELVTIEGELPWTNSVPACFMRMKAERE